MIFQARQWLKRTFALAGVAIVIMTLAGMAATTAERARPSIIHDHPMDWSWIVGDLLLGGLVGFGVGGLMVLPTVGLLHRKAPILVLCTLGPATCIVAFAYATTHFSAMWLGLPAAGAAVFAYLLLALALQFALPNRDPFDKDACPCCGYDLRGNVTNGQDARSTRQDARSTGCPECGWNRSEPRP